MDRRKRKTREAIFDAFTQLLSEKNYAQITVGEIIERADVGRATFYAHFETKDYLLKSICEELFCHIFDSIDGNKHGHKHIFDCALTDSAFLHLFKHLKNNDNNIFKLLSCRNNEMFLNYFKAGLVRLIEKQEDVFLSPLAKKLPKSFWTNHVASTFVETVKWWMETKCRQSPEEITEYFLRIIHLA